MADNNTYRVVVVYSDQPGFFGASGVFSTKAEAQGALLDLARTWVGLANPVLQESGSFIIEANKQRTVTYSILTERRGFKMTAAQYDKLKDLCHSYKVGFDPNDYVPQFDCPPGFLGGWIGGPGQVGKTIYIGVGPEGDSHS